MRDTGPQQGGTPPLSQAADAWARRVSRAVAAGDPQALAEFYRAWFARSLAAARSATGRDESFCLDVVQDAMVKAAARLRPVATASELAAWMDRVVRSCALDRLRSEAARAKREQWAGTPRPLSPHADAQPRLDWLTAGLAAASPTDQDLLRHRIIAGATLDQAALASGLTAPAVHGRLRRLLALLRKAAPAGKDDAREG